MNDSSPTRQTRIHAFLAANGFDGATLLPLKGDASFRRYIRIEKGHERAMLMDAPPEKEDIRPYLQVAGHLAAAGYSPPRVLASDETLGLMLLEDLGDDTFTRLLAANQADEQELYAAAIDVLAQWYAQRQALADAALPRYDQALLMREVQLFSNWYLPQVSAPAHTASLQAEYTALWRELLAPAVPMNCFVHRDYHADNLMWLAKRRGVARVGLLDFQDAVAGGVAYDVVSLLEDARRDVPVTLAEAMLARFISATGIDRDIFMAQYALLGAQRNSKIIGIFTRLAARDGKPHYLQYLPRVWKHLERDVSHPQLAPLKAWLDAHVGADGRGVITVRHDARALALSA